MMHRRTAYLVWLVVLVMEGDPAAVAILVLLTVLETVADTDNPGVWAVNQPACLHRGITRL